MFAWLNPPSKWNGNDSAMEVVTDANTDFWRHTFYGFVRDSGHAYLRPVSGDFTAAVVAYGDYQALYDQAGLFLRLDERHWIKAGIEFTDGLMHFSTVVTNDVSDWSVIPLPDARPDDAVAIRLTWRCSPGAILARSRPMAVGATGSLPGARRQNRRDGVLSGAGRLQGAIRGPCRRACDPTRSAFKLDVGTKTPAPAGFRSLPPPRGRNYG